MTRDNGPQNLESAKLFFLALEKHDKIALDVLLDAEVVEVIPLSNTGDPKPFSEFKGKDAVIGYLHGIIDNFVQTVLLNKRYYVSDDGSTVFVEANGDLIQAKTNKPYNNVYIFKFVFADTKIIHISEYANPIAYSKIAGLPIG